MGRGWWGMVGYGDFNLFCVSMFRPDTTVETVICVVSVHLSLIRILTGTLAPEALKFSYFEFVSLLKSTIVTISDSVRALAITPSFSSPNLSQYIQSRFQKWRKITFFFFFLSKFRNTPTSQKVFHAYYDINII